VIDPELQRLCWAEISIFGALGMGLGIAFGDPADNPATSEVSSVVAARYYSSRPQSISSLPRLPCGMFFAMLFSIAPVLRNGCQGFAGQHMLFLIGLGLSALSTGSWLLIASALQRGISNQRRMRIDEFISDSTAPVPAPVPGLDSYSWLKIWNWMNTACFILLILALARNILLLPPSSWPWNS
jgi:hypothetical protein